MIARGTVIKPSASRSARAHSREQSARRVLLRHANPLPRPHSRPHKRQPSLVGRPSPRLRVARAHTSIASLLGWRTPCAAVTQALPRTAERTFLHVACKQAQTKKQTKSYSARTVFPSQRRQMPRFLSPLRLLMISNVLRTQVSCVCYLEKGTRKILCLRVRSVLSTLCLTRSRSSQLSSVLILILLCPKRMQSTFISMTTGVTCLRVPCHLLGCTCVHQLALVPFLTKRTLPPVLCQHAVTSLRLLTLTTTHVAPKQSHTAAGQAFETLLAAAQASV